MSVNIRAHCCDAIQYMRWGVLKCCSRIAWTEEYFKCQNVLDRHFIFDQHLSLSLSSIRDIKLNRRDGHDLRSTLTLKVCTNGHTFDPFDCYFTAWGGGRTSISIWLLCVANRPWSSSTTIWSELELYNPGWNVIAVRYLSIASNASLIYINDLLLRFRGFAF